MQIEQIKNKNLRYQQNLREFKKNNLRLLHFFRNDLENHFNNLIPNR